ncbi:hypothetical protein OJ920_11890, partial [Streptococcus anginosus]|nr:hypothetical protein [Streptococcus anginosus]
AYTAPQFDQQNPYGQPGVQPEQPYGQYNGGQYGANGFGQAPYGMTFQMTPLAQELKSNSTIVLILGILGLVLIGLF